MKLFGSEAGFFQDFLGEKTIMFNKFILIICELLSSSVYIESGMNTITVLSHIHTL